MGRRSPVGGAPAQALRLLVVAIPCASGDNYVLKKYQDAACTRMMRGTGSQQSWKRIGGMHSHCYHVMTGFACQFTCFMRMRCQYGSGSGVVLEDMSDNTCTGEANGRRPLASDWTWLKAKGFFDGSCTQLDVSTWMRFVNPLGSQGYPDCESEGAVATVGETSPNAFQADYVLQFYRDGACTDEYAPTTYSTQTSSRFRWRVHRGVQHCYDYVDETPQSNSSTSRLIPQSIYNFNLVCGNTDMTGNGIRIKRNDGRVCSGRASALEDWRAVFYPMNFPTASQLFRGQCVRWGTYFVKFDKAFEQAHYPDCTNWACASGFCAGGRVGVSVWRPFAGSISTLPSSTSDAVRGCPLMWHYAMVLLCMAVVAVLRLGA